MNIYLTTTAQRHEDKGVIGRNEGLKKSGKIHYNKYTVSLYACMFYNLFKPCLIISAFVFKKNNLQLKNE